jgi:hypothetical protein
MPENPMFDRLTQMNFFKYRIKIFKIIPDTPVKQIRWQDFGIWGIGKI